MPAARLLMVVTFLLGPLVACGKGGSGADAEMQRRDGSLPRDARSPQLDAGRVRCASGMRCDGRCVDTATDAENCGGCGRICELPNAAARCVAGECEVAQCVNDFANCDGEAATGCEHPNLCSAGAACDTECGTEGVIRCDDPCMPACTPPAETCNGADEDCNGVCDDGAGCRIGVHRSSGSSGHFYTTDAREANCCGYAVEQLDYYYLYTQDVGGLAPLFRCRKSSGKPFYTRSADCEMGIAPELTLGFIATEAGCGATPLYRLHRRSIDNHVYTTSVVERDRLIASGGYVYELTTGYVWNVP